jgi:hypothetical protein
MDYKVVDTDSQVIVVPEHEQVEGMVLYEGTKDDCEEYVSEMDADADFFGFNVT